MAEIHLKNLAHSHHPQPQQDSDYALKQIDHVWEEKSISPIDAAKTPLLGQNSGLAILPSK